MKTKRRQLFYLLISCFIVTIALGMPPVLVGAVCIEYTADRAIQCYSNTNEQIQLHAPDWFVGIQPGVTLNYLTPGPGSTNIVNNLLEAHLYVDAGAIHPIRVNEWAVYGTYGNRIEVKNAGSIGALDHDGALHLTFGNRITLSNGGRLQGGVRMTDNNRITFSRGHLDGHLIAGDNNLFRAQQKSHLGLLEVNDLNTIHLQDDATFLRWNDEPIARAVIANNMNRLIVEDNAVVAVEWDAGLALQMNDGNEVLFYDASELRAAQGIVARDFNRIAFADDSMITITGMQGTGIRVANDNAITLADNAVLGMLHGNINGTGIEADSHNDITLQGAAAVTATFGIDAFRRNTVRLQDASRVSGAKFGIRLSEVNALVMTEQATVEATQAETWGVTANVLNDIQLYDEATVNVTGQAAHGIRAVLNNTLTVNDDAAITVSGRSGIGLYMGWDNDARLLRQAAVVAAGANSVGIDAGATGNMVALYDGATVTAQGNESVGIRLGSAGTPGLNTLVVGDQADIVSSGIQTVGVEALEGNAIVLQGASSVSVASFGWGIRLGTANDLLLRDRASIETGIGSAGIAADEGNRIVLADEARIVDTGAFNAGVHLVRENYFVMRDEATVATDYDGSIAVALDEGNTMHLRDDASIHTGGDESTGLRLGDDNVVVLYDDSRIVSSGADAAAVSSQAATLMLADRARIETTGAGNTAIRMEGDGFVHVDEGAAVVAAGDASTAYRAVNGGTLLNMGTVRGTDRAIHVSTTTGDTFALENAGFIHGTVTAAGSGEHTWLLRAGSLVAGHMELAGDNTVHLAGRVTGAVTTADGDDAIHLLRTADVLDIRLGRDGAKSVFVEAGAEVRGRILGGGGALSTLTLHGAGDSNDIPLLRAGDFGRALLTDGGTWRVSGGGFGTFDVEDGTLLLAGNTLATGELRLQSDGGRHGELRGDGTIHGNVVNGGVISPGHSIGTIIIDGDYVQSHDGVLLVETELQGGHDQLHVTGQAIIDGGAVAFTWEPGVYGRRTEYNIIRTDGGVSGDGFHSLSPTAVSSYLLQPSLEVDAAAQNVLLVLNRRSLVSVLVNPTPSQKAAAEALERQMDSKAGTRDPVLEKLLFETKQDDIAALATTMTGDLYATLPFVQWQTMDWFGNAVMEAGDASAFTYGDHVWVRHDSGNSAVTVHVGEPDQRARFGHRGVTAGVHLSPDYPIQTGVAVGVANTDLISSPWGQKEGTQLGVGVYGEGEVGNVSVRAAVAIGTDRYDVQRPVLVPGEQLTAQQQLRGHQWIAAVHGRWPEITVAGLTFQPEAGGQWLHLSRAGGTEDGADAFNLMVKEAAGSALVGVVGMHLAEAGWQTKSGLLVTPRAHIRWTQPFIEHDNTVSLRFAVDPDSEFTLHGPRLMGGLRVDLGMTAEVPDTLRLHIAYTVEPGPAAVTHRVTLGAVMPF